MENFPQIPGYRIIKNIGEGATALVFMGINESSNRRVAIKVLKPVLQENEEYSYRFLREAKIAKGLNHSNIIKIYHVGEPGEYYIVMEYLEDSLNGKLKDGIGLTEREIIKIFKKVAGALHYAHSRGVIHRDIKPANILFRRDGTPVLTDFGLARKVDSITRFTKTGTTMGTPAYMSPEQCKGLKVDHQSDIYNLGVVLFQMLTGKLPYRGRTNQELWDKHVNSPIPQLPPELKRYQPLIKCIMAKEKRKRINSAKQAILILEHLSRMRRENEPGNTSEILKFKGNFFHNHKNWLVPVLLVITTIALMVVIAMIFLKVSRPTPIDNSQTQKKTPIRNTINSRNHPLTTNQEGKIIFKPIGSTYSGGVQVQLLYENLMSSRGTEIPSEIYYTIDGSEPTKDNGEKYNPENKILLNGPGRYQIKARLFSKLGKYEGNVHLQTYIIEKLEPKAITVENVEELDKDIRDDIFENTKKLIINVNGVENVIKGDYLKMIVFISKNGQAKVLKISNIDVIPKEKSEEIKDSLVKKIQAITFKPPTVIGKHVNVKIEILFNKISILKGKIFLER